MPWIRVDLDIDLWPEWDECPPGAMEVWTAILRIIANHGDREAGQIEIRRCSAALVARRARIDSHAGPIIEALISCGLLERNDTHYSADPDRWVESFKWDNRDRERKRLKREGVQQIMECRQPAHKPAGHPADIPRTSTDHRGTGAGASGLRDATVRDATVRDEEEHLSSLRDDGPPVGEPDECKQGTDNGAPDDSPAAPERRPSSPSPGRDPAAGTGAAGPDLPGVASEQDGPGAAQGAGAEAGDGPGGGVPEARRFHPVLGHELPPDRCQITRAELLVLIGEKPTHDPPPKPKKEAPTSKPTNGAIPWDKMLARFNGMAKACPGVTATRTGWTAERKATVERRAKACGLDPDQLIFRLCYGIENDDHYSGRNAGERPEKHQNWRLDINWLLRPANCTKILDRAYEIRAQEEAAQAEQGT